MKLCKIEKRLNSSPRHQFKTYFQINFETQERKIMALEWNSRSSDLCIIENLQGNFKHAGMQRNLKIFLKKSSARDSGKNFHSKNRKTIGHVKCFGQNKYFVVSPESIPNFSNYQSILLCFESASNCTKIVDMH